MFLRACFLNGALLASLLLSAKTIPVKNQQELTVANTLAKPGDVVLLKNGEWNNVSLNLSCRGTKEMPITFKAETAGKVIITGYSTLSIGGNYIVVDGFYFTNGYSGKESVITFRNNSDKIANNCRVTNTIIDDFNNVKRLDENYWISFYGKNNRLDHCSFYNKKNIGVLLAIILDDDRSRENFHVIDHNYFGVRIPLASNGGEIIRIGVSEHCQFNSNTQIIDNYFEHCDGETEIISIKSCKNVVRNNLFKECQGGVVLRHGNFNTVENNIFWGNNKVGSGGVRIINKGQWVANNLFYKCRGEGFRSPMSIMNGIPNSPANRYLEVSEAVIINNSFYECAPISFCEGSDAERSIPPHDVTFLNNLFYNTKDSLLYNAYDNISGINFMGNIVSNTINQKLNEGFIKDAVYIQHSGILPLPKASASIKFPMLDSIIALSKTRLTIPISSKQGLSDSTQLQKIINNATTKCGAIWARIKMPAKKTITANCKTATEVIAQLTANLNNKIIIQLTGNTYHFKSSLSINNDVVITSTKKQMISFDVADSTAPYLIQLKAGNALILKHVQINLGLSANQTFIITDSSGNSNHCNFSMINCSINNCKGTFFSASLSNVSDSIVINNCNFKNGSGDIFTFMNEHDKKGYYNVEKLKITHCTFIDGKGQILAMLRSGKDESTMGPTLVFSNNTIQHSSTKNKMPLIYLYGIQKTLIEKNKFTDCNEGNTLIQYEDLVRATHILKTNSFSKSGAVHTDKFVVSEPK